MDSHEKFLKNLEKRTSIHGEIPGGTLQSLPGGHTRLGLLEQKFSSKFSAQTVKPTSFRFLLSAFSFWCQGGTDNQQDEFVPSCWGVIP